MAGQRWVKSVPREGTPSPFPLLLTAAVGGLPAGGFKFPVPLGARLTDVDQGTPGLVHERGRTLVETLGEFTNRLYALIQFAAVSARQTGHDGVDLRYGAVELCQGAFDAVDGTIGFAKNAGDLISLACKLRRIGLEILYRFVHAHLIGDEELVS